MQKITKKQYETLKEIEQFIAFNGYSPTIRELAEILGLRSPAPAQSRVDALILSGVALVVTGRARTLQVLTPSSQFVKADRERSDRWQCYQRKEAIAP
jgi:repressor LexA